MARNRFGYEKRQKELAKKKRKDLETIESLEGTQFGLDITRPYFLGPNNVLFLTGSISTPSRLRRSQLRHCESDWWWP